MTSPLSQLAGDLDARFADAAILLANGQLQMTVASDDWLDTATALRDEFDFDMLIDLAGVDYLHYGIDEWQTEDASSEGFSRAVKPSTAGHFTFTDAAAEKQNRDDRFAVIVQLLSIEGNCRLSVKIYCPDPEFPVIASVVDVWNSANWFERECFDLFGIAFDGHPDLRRILTDYGFVGHPFRKDFPLTGHVEMRYDEAQQRVVYQPVSIEPRVLVPRVIRDDYRYVEGDGVAEDAADG